MFSYIKGTIELKQENLLVLECGGIGYELLISNSSLVKLPQVGQEAKVYTYFNVRETEITLFGFADIEEKDMFLKLTSVNGVGPKMGITILSGIEFNHLCNAIISGDIAVLNKVKGVGKKTAERIILELRNKISPADALPIMHSADSISAFVLTDAVVEATEALTLLGLNKRDAEHKAKLVAKVSDSAEDIIEKVLKGRY